MVLNYNSAADVEVLLPQLRSQQGVNHTVILVDNASRQADLDSCEAAFYKTFPLGYVASVNDSNLLAAGGSPGLSAYLVINTQNSGYSAGNNIGIRLAIALECDAVLIANPDMRISDPLYIKKLTAPLFAEENTCIAASRIIGLDGEDQNPMYEPKFLEEAFWFIWILLRRFNTSVNVRHFAVKNGAPLVVSKVSGCCMMLKTSFLKDIGLLDEGVFLYSEEPILSAQVRQRAGKTAYISSISAIHAHKKSAKESSSKRMAIFIKSRRYYLEKYSGYTKWKLSILTASYFLLGLYHRMKLKFTK